MIDFKTIKKPYFLGIGGIGVSAIARMMLHEGKQVSGSDSSDSEIIKELQKVGADIFIGQDVSHIPNDTDLVIYSIALEKFVPDFMKDVRAKIKDVISYPEALSIISKDKYTIAIAGTHGKTTTTAMLAKIMMDAGLDPTVIVGSLMSDSKSNFVAGKSKYLVVEACEYCRSFLEINPTVIGITTIDSDHLDYYKDLEDIVSAFNEFKAKIPVNGKVIETGDVFDPSLKLRIPGDHNRKNASLALAIADHLGIDKEKAKRSLENFSGTWRRFEYKGKTENGAFVYDDYGHHPTEIAATILGAKELYPDKKIIVAFQPHLFSRTKELLSGFAQCFANSDEAIILPIYPAREVFDPSISSEMLVNNIKNTKAFFVPDFDAATDLLAKFGEDSVIILSGAGDIDKLAPQIIHER
ncbi:MAG: Mur ligase domain-containing protein [Patescibacteria group bacterium]